MSILIKGMEMPEGEEILCLDIYRGKAFINFDLERKKTVDAISIPQIVFCMNCKHYKLSEYNTFGIHVCEKRGGVVGDHDFCSRGEKEESE